jgi:TonB family protein
MKPILLTLRRILRSTTALALFATLLLAPHHAASFGTLTSSNQPIFQETTQTPQQDKATAEALAEAAQLSGTVVKLYNEGQYDKAVPLAKRAVELREQALGPDHELVQAALLNLAEIYTAKKKYGEAQKLVERLLKTYEKTLGPEDLGVAVFLNKLGFLTYVQGDFSKSETAYKRALAIREKATGRDNKEFAISLFTLAELYRFTARVAKAEPLYEEAAVLLLKLLGPADPDYLKVKDKYFCIAYLARDGNRDQRIKDFSSKLRVTAPIQVDKVEGGVLNGQAISLPKPAYPDDARSARAQGTVVIKVTVDEQGNVMDAWDMCGANPLLAKPALEAARAARFTPTTLSGRPVKVSGVITYNFVVR